MRCFRAHVVVVLALVGGCHRDAADRTRAPAEVAPPLQTSRALVRVRNTIAIGDHQACVLTADDGVACWASSRADVKAKQVAPTAVAGPSDVVGVVASRDVVCAWTRPGAVWCWGGGDAPDGDGPAEPRRIRGITDAVQVVAHHDGACALRHDGHVACWDGEAWRSPLWPPVEDVASLSNAVEIAWADDALCARARAGDVLCTVRRAAKLRAESIRDSEAKTLPELHGATSLAGAGDTFAALLPEDRLAVWRMADVDGRTVPAVDEPIRITSEMPGVRVVLGGWPAHLEELCLTGDTTRCWPAGSLSAHASDPPPAPRALGPAVEDVALGGEVSCLRREGRLLCWGDTSRLGGEAPAGFSFVPVTDALQLESNVDAMCALRATGRVVCWGARAGATHPDGTPIIDASPSELPVVDDAVELAMSADDICVRRRNGQVACWTTSRIGAQNVRESETLVGVTRLLSSSTAICGVQATGAVVCAASTTGDPRIDADTRAALEKSLAAGSPCAKSPRGRTTCWRGAGPVTAVFDDSDERQCVVQDGRVSCHRGDDTVAAVDPMRGRTDVVSYDGRYAITADARVVTADPSYEGRAPVDALLDVAQLRANLHVVCARTREGRVSCWGEPDYLGTGAASVAEGPVTLAVALGTPRPFTPEPIALEAPAPLSTKPVVRLRGVRMAGPFLDVAHACASVRCKAGETLHCGEPTQPMSAAPTPLRAVSLLPIDCRPEGDTHDETTSYRLLVSRADGRFLSGPLVKAGGDDRSCSGAVATRWVTRGALVTLDVATDTRCQGPNGDPLHGVELLVGLTNGTTPQTFAPIQIGVASATAALELTTELADDGILTVSGPPRWPQSEGATEPGVTPVGRYRFVPR